MYVSQVNAGSTLCLHGAVLCTHQFTFPLYVFRPLVYLGMNLMNHFDVCSSLGCDENVLYNWLVTIEMNYNAKNSYHTSTHAADVMQATAGFLERERLKQILDPLDEAVCLIAAAAHDVDHPGKSRFVEGVC